MSAGKGKGVIGVPESREAVLSRWITFGLGLLVAVLAALGPGAAEAQECAKNLSFVLDWPSVGQVVDQYVTSEDVPYNLYVMIRRGPDTYLKVGVVETVLDGIPATSPRIVLGDSVLLASSAPPLAFDVLERGATTFSDLWAAMALGRAGVGIIQADPGNLHSANLISRAIPVSGIVWDVRALPSEMDERTHAHIFAAAGTGGLQMYDFVASDASLNWQGSASLPGDARALETVITAQDTLVLVANGQGLWAFRSDGTQPANVPKPSAAALDPETQRMYLIPGGYADTLRAWSFELGTGFWTNLSPGVTDSIPQWRFGHQAVFDSVRRRVVVYGGSEGEPEAYVPGRWFRHPWALDLDSLKWKEIRPSVPAPDSMPRSKATVICDPGKDRMIVFGGFWDSTSYPLYADHIEDQTWAFDFGDSSWADLTPDSTCVHPAARAAAAGVYVPGNATRPPRLVLFGGENTTLDTRYADLWSLDLVTDTWSPALAFGVPPPAHSSQIAIYDDTRDRVVFYGDTLGSRSAGPDAIWYLDMAASAPNPTDMLGTWGSYQPPFVSFSPRVDMAAVFDRARGGAVAFGGFDSLRTTSPESPPYSDLNLLDFRTWQWSRLRPALVSGAGSVETNGSAEGLAVWGDTVFVADGLSGISVIDASPVFAGTDTVMTVVDTINVGGYARSVHVMGPYLYVACQDKGVRAWLAGNPDSGIVADYPYLYRTQKVFAIGWGAQTVGPDDSAFVFVADEDHFTILRQEAVDITPPFLNLAIVEGPGLPGRFSAYSLASECLDSDSLFTMDGLEHRFTYAWRETISCDTTGWDSTGAGDPVPILACSTVVHADSTAADTLDMDPLDVAERIYASHLTLDIRAGLEALAETVSGLIPDSLRLKMSWKAVDIVGNVGNGSKSVAVGTVEGAAGGRVRALNPAIVLDVPAGSFRGREQFYFLEEEPPREGMPPASVRWDPFLDLPDPALQGLVLAGAACQVGWTAASLEKPLQLTLPTCACSTVSPPGHGLAVYRLEGERWQWVGGRLQGDGVVASIEESGIYRVLQGGQAEPLPSGIALLHQNVPNPFNPVTAIRYWLPRAGTASLKVFDVQGRLIRTLFSGHREAGEGSVLWQGEDEQGRGVAAGVYFYRLETDQERPQTRKMVLLK